MKLSINIKVVITLYILLYPQISYKNSTMEPILMTLPGCNTLCPLDEFINLTRNAVPEDWERECLIGWEDISPSDVIGNYYLSVEYIFIYDLRCSIWCVHNSLFGCFSNPDIVYIDVSFISPNNNRFYILAS